MHCGSIPSNTVGLDKPATSRVKILHYGNYDKKIREKKFDFYTKVDPNNKMTDGYQHIISDKGKFSGKQGMVFRNLPKGVYLENP